MKLKVLALVTSLIVVAAIGLSWQRLTTAETTVPVGLAVTPDNQDLGRVKYGEIPTADFEVRNQGNGPLQITRISTSCGCTIATLVGYEDQLKNSQAVSLSAGGSLVMRVFFNPAIHEDDTDLGTITRTIYVRSTDEQQPETQVTITAEVYR